jgi:hypothetical protein
MSFTTLMENIQNLSENEIYFLKETELYIADVNNEVKKTLKSFKFILEAYEYKGYKLGSIPKNELNQEREKINKKLTLYKKQLSKLLKIQGSASSAAKATLNLPIEHLKKAITYLFYKSRILLASKEHKENLKIVLNKKMIMHNKKISNYNGTRIDALSTKKVFDVRDARADRNRLKYYQENPDFHKMESDYIKNSEREEKWFKNGFSSN